VVAVPAGAVLVATGAVDVAPTGVLVAVRVAVLVAAPVVALATGAVEVAVRVAVLVAAPAVLVGVAVPQATDGL